MGKRNKMEFLVHIFSGLKSVITRATFIGAHKHNNESVQWEFCVGGENKPWLHTLTKPSNQEHMHLESCFWFIKNYIGRGSVYIVVCYSPQRDYYFAGLKVTYKPQIISQKFKLNLPCKRGINHA